MKIYDHENKKILSSISLFLTPEEALELASSAEDLGHNPIKHHHHINDAEYASEIIVAVYTPENLDSFDLESRSVIIKPSEQ